MLMHQAKNQFSFLPLVESGPPKHEERSLAVMILSALGCLARGQASNRPGFQTFSETFGVAKFESCIPRLARLEAIFCLSASALEGVVLWFWLASTWLL